MTFGGRIKNLRKEHNMTQRQLADRIGVAKSVVSYYESGDRFPSNDVLIKLTKLFHVTSDYLLGIESLKYLDVSDLSSEDIAVLEILADRLRFNKKY